MTPPSVVIRKYGNRRLYDTSASRYVNLDEIAVMVRNGTDVQVIDAATGEDLTRVILTQIIAENAKGPQTGLPLELLRQLIVTSDHVGQEFLMWYLKSAYDTYQKVQNAVQSGLTEVRSAAMSPLQAALSPLEAMKSFIRGAAPEKQVNADEVDQLRRRIAELEARLADQPTSRAEQQKPSRRAKTPKRRKITV